MTVSAPLREQIQNSSSSTLNGAINNSVTTVTVTTGANFPSAGNYRVRVGTEIMLVTARSTNDLTVVRGYEGTTAASHSSGDACTLVLTAGSLGRWAQDAHPMWGVTRPPYGLYDTDGKTLLTTADFTWTNQGSDQPSPIRTARSSWMHRRPLGENYRIQRRSAPSPTYTVIAGFQHTGIIEPSSYQTFGLVFRQSTSGKFIAFGMASHNGNHPLQVAGFNLTSETTYQRLVHQMHRRCSSCQCSG
jgi:hypothetical protein